jgi:hypothetical protein
MSATVLTLRQGNVHRFLRLSEKEAVRFNNMARGYVAMVRALEQIAKHPGARAEQLSEFAELTLRSLDAEMAEVPFDG